MEKKFKLTLFFMLVFFVSGCSEQDYSPKEIKKEVDVCLVCNMSIVHEGYEAQVVLANKDHLMYDDIGCLVQDVLQKEDNEIGASYVKEYGTNEWIEVSDAFYVFDPVLWTPMSYGVVAFSTKEAADQFINQEGKGKLLSFDDLQQHEWGVHHQ
ncbi:nitrous oxide reductase accessory protein NosL [Bacillus carboniphilus]|uniref:Nitrous oxide reductase accessory protein NosL n=1 Tax=Bacillus carboniphilus TaxID=86663 RepID=A0ABY9JU82_9BACI|nr:nitrous oxide reductase accessory protein NosL [Bacillus carboniphilus]WLR41225.1 nitrous oxide reductase accessory protein NosL [Bacillus carboniphilus]